MKARLRAWRRWFLYLKYRYRQERIVRWAEYIIKYHGIKQNGGEITFKGDTYAIEKSNLGGTLTIRRQWPVNGDDYFLIWDGKEVTRCHLGFWVVCLEGKARAVRQARFADA